MRRLAAVYLPRRWLVHLSRSASGGVLSRDTRPPCPGGGRGGEMQAGADALLEERAGQAARDRMVAFQPVQGAGTITSGASCSSALTVSPMTGSNSGPARWNPPMTACSFAVPVSRWA